MNVMPDVDQLMAGGLANWLAGQQEARNEAKKKSSNRMWTGMISGAAIALFLLLTTGKYAWAIVLLGLAFTLSSPWAAAARKPVIYAIKAQMNAKIAETLGLGFSIRGEPGPEYIFAQKYGLLPSFDRDEIEDFWTGEIPTGAFSLYEAHLEERRGSGKNQRWVTVFRGAIITLRFARNFHGVTLVERDNERSKFFGLRNSINIDGQKLERVQMVDPRFEDYSKSGPQILSRPAIWFILAMSNG